MQTQINCMILVFLLGIPLGILAQNTIDRTTHFNIKEGIAIQGYDPVAYFMDQPKKGSIKYAANHQGINYYFSSEKNKETFLANPSQYEPQYGGWCAYAMGDSGEKVKINPKAYKIVEGKLYLFYKKIFNNTLKSWNKNEAQLMPKADDYWWKIIN